MGKHVHGWRKKARVQGKPRAAPNSLRGVPLLGRDSYVIFDVSVWPLIGAAPKDLVRVGGRDNSSAPLYIAKASRLRSARTIECVTEEVISQIGAMLPLKVARSRLCRLKPTFGEVETRFMSRVFLDRATHRLIHGVELFAWYLDCNAEEMNAAFNLRDKESEHQFYTLETVTEVLRAWGRDEGEKRNLLDGIGRMIVFDAIVGSADRHGQNWGAIECVANPEEPRRFAPVFDTARGLLWNHPDGHLLQRLERESQVDFVKKYCENSRPVFGCGKRSGGGRANHFELVEYLLRHYDDELGPGARAMIHAAHWKPIGVMLRRRFGGILSAVRIGLIEAILEYRIKRLKEIERGRRK